MRVRKKWLFMECKPMNNPLIFIHGAGDSARAWKEQTAYFGARAHAIDLPGHGTRPDNLPEQVSALDYA
ncbi:MAG: alpha/beta fold hydrolase, partial [Ktedonobacteraceae bacterium]